MLPEGPISWAEREDLRPRIALSNAVFDWTVAMAEYLKNDTSANPPQRPSSDLSNYSRDTGLAAVAKEIGVLTRLFGEAKNGDLVIVPGPARGRNFYVGVLQDDPSQRVRAELGKEYLGEHTLGRRVKWFPPIDEFLVPIEMSTIFRTQSALIEIPAEFLFTVCDLSYGTYFKGNHFASRLRTLAPEFMSQDAMDLSVLAQTSAKLAAKYRHGQILSYTLDEILSSTLKDEDQLSISININSPGFLISKGSSLAPLVFVVLFSLFTHGDAYAKPHSDTITIVNSLGGPEDACVPQINQIVKGALDSMGFELWQSQCERAIRLSENPKLKSEATVVSKDATNGH